MVTTPSILVVVKRSQEENNPLGGVVSRQNDSQFKHHWATIAGEILLSGPKGFNLSTQPLIHGLTNPQAPYTPLLFVASEARLD